MYQQRVTRHLIPCVGQFAVALADDTRWKTLNYQILLRSRHGDAKVSAGAAPVPRASHLRLHTELRAICLFSVYKQLTAAPPQVRFSSLLVLMELASKLKENYMVLLPETVPFLAELMEGEHRLEDKAACRHFLTVMLKCVCVPDECEEVEQQVHKVVQEMENILGEPLQSYF